MRFDLSIIILSYNTKDITKDCLLSIRKSLQKSSLKVEIIVVDNNSTDGSVQAIKKLAKNFTNPQLKVYALKKNLGYAKGNNFAAKKANSDTLLFLNSDTIIRDQAIEKLYQFFQKNHRKYQFAAPKLLNPDLSPQPSAGYFYSLPVVFAVLFLKADSFKITRFSPDKIKEVDWVSGAAFITKKEYFEKINGFDENIFMYFDEVDLFLRAAKAGMRVVFFPKAEIIHLESASSTSEIKKTFPILQFFKGLIYIYKKHHSRSQLELVKAMIRIKAEVSYLIGKITNNKYLIKTYAQAKKIAQNN